jgi:hypothetical protein
MTKEPNIPFKSESSIEDLYFASTGINSNFLFYSFISGIHPFGNSALHIIDL